MKLTPGYNNFLDFCLESSECCKLYNKLSFIEAIKLLWTKSVVFFATFGWKTRICLPRVVRCLHIECKRFGFRVMPSSSCQHGFRAYLCYLDEENSTSTNFPGNYWG